MLRIGIDWGGTKIEAIGLDEEGGELARRRVPTPRDDYDGCIHAVCDLVAYIEQQAGRRGTVGVGIPGSPHPVTSLIRNANSTWINGRPLGKDLSSALGREVRLANDATCFAVSEALDGAGAGYRSVLGLIIGTGHGGGFVVNGEVYGGANGSAAEVGHIPLPWMSADEFPGEPCWCGQRGCIERYVSGTGFEDDFWRISGVRCSAVEIIAAKRSGDGPAQAAYERYVDRLGRGLAVLVNVLDPEVVVLGGGMSNILEIYLDLPPRVAPYVFGGSFDAVVVQARHGDSSGVRGAAGLWKTT